MSAPIRLIVDTPQNRVKSDGVSVLCGREDWDSAAATNFFLDGTSGTGFLTPAPYLPGWISSGSGIYAKLPFSAWTFTGSGNWVSYGVNPDTSPFYQYDRQSSDSGNAGGYSASSFLANQAFVIEYFVDNTTQGNSIAIEFGISTTHDGTDGVSMRVYLDGRAEIWEDGTMTGTYTLSGKTPEYGQTDGVQKGTQNGYVALLFIPCREREILVISGSGASFSHVIQSIPEGEEGAIITDAAPFWFNFPAPASANLRIAALQYAASGEGLSKQSFFAIDPGPAPTGGFQFDFFGEIPPDSSPGSATVSAVDGVITTNPYSGAADGIRVKVGLTAGTNAQGYVTSPFVYGARVYTLPEIVATSNENYDLTEFYQEGLHLEVTDTAGGTSGHVVFNNPTAIEEIGAIGIGTQTRRPVEIHDENGLLFVGTFNVPKRRYEHGGADPNYLEADIELAETVEGNLRDMWQFCEDAVAEDPIPLDGEPFDDAYSYLASLVGRSANVSSSYHSFLLPSAGNSTGSHEFALLVKPGDKISEWLDRLVKTYACTAFHGVGGLDLGSPGVLQVIDPSDMPTEPVATFYDSVERSISAGNSFEESLNLLFRDFDDEQVEPEANHIGVVGYDFRSRRPLIYTLRDLDSIDPTIPAASRPSNWLGFSRKCGWVDPSLRTIQNCQDCADLLYDRMTQQRQLVQFTAEYNPNVKRGSMVQLVGTRMGTLLARIRTISIDVLNVDSRLAIWRPTRYVAQVGIDCSPLNASGTRLHEIRHEWKLKAYSKTYHWGDKNHGDVWTRPRIAAGVS